MRAFLASLSCGLMLVSSVGADVAWAKKRPSKKSRKAKGPEARAFELFTEARNDFLAKRFQEASDKLEKAYGMFKHPMILYRWAEALENLRKIEAALELYQRKDLRNAKDPKIRVPARSAIRRLEALMDQPVQVSIISGDVVGALIFVDGKPFGTTPALIKLPRGEHELKVTKEGHQPYVVPAFVVAGLDTIKVEAELKPFVGQVKVRVPTGDFTDTRVLIDGRLVPIADAMATETALIDVPVGKHQLECARTGIASYYRPFLVKAGDAIVLNCAFGARASGGEEDSLNWWGIGVTIGGGLTAIGGAILLGSYFADVQLAEDLGKELKSSKDIAGGVLLGVGGAALITGIVMLAVGYPSTETEENTEVLAPEDASLQVIPTVGPNAAGLSFSGSF